MKKKVLIAYPNLHMMFTPSIAVGLFNAIAKEEDIELELFETAEYSDEFENKFVHQIKLGINRSDIKDDIIEDSYWWIKGKDQIVPDFIEHLNRFNPDLILMYAQEDVWDQTIKLLEVSNKRSIPHIVGGNFPLADPDYVIQHSEVNIICRYEGETTVRQAYQAIKNNLSLFKLDGIWWKDDKGNIVKNKPAPLVDINLVLPDFSCYEDKNISKRWSRPMGGKMFNVVAAMETYRGCPYNCTYCNSPTTRDVARKLDLGNFLRRKSIDTIERELNSLIEKLNPGLIMMSDDSFLARPGKEIFEFAKMWSKYKIPFWMNTRVENCKPDYLAALKEAGLYRFNMGIESGNEEYRTKILQRPVTNQKYYEMFKHINDSNIPYALNTIIGMPFETREVVLDTARMLKAAGGWDGLVIAAFQPYRGTVLGQMARDAGFVKENAINVGGFVNEKVLTMPKPYLQKDEISGLVRALPLYAFYKEDMWDYVKLAETDDNVYQELLAEYKKLYYHGNYQTGGKDRQGNLKDSRKFCDKHDISSTYVWEAIVA